MNIFDNDNICNLIDWYGVLLTDKQKLIMNDYFFNNYSLYEISQNLGISRQAVSCSIKQSISKLLEYESKLKSLENFNKFILEFKHKFSIIEFEKICKILKGSN